MTTEQKSLFDDQSKVAVQDIVNQAHILFAGLRDLPESSRIDALNSLRRMLHVYSPFKNEPVDCISWVGVHEVEANDYNPNSVAPPEMKLLAHSIAEDGYTQPVVVWRNGLHYEVVDGFHRNRVCRENSEVQKRTKGYLPVVIINDEKVDRGDRIASTIRHNRARGKHRVEGMSDIVIELKRRNWTDERIAQNLGMDQDEILRLCQITGLADIFSDQEFSKSWDVEGEVTESDFKELTDDISTYGEGSEKFRTVNTSDEQRVFHTYDKWECYHAGFYATSKEGMSKAECHEAYRAFLADHDQFTETLEHVIAEWKHSCEHYLTNAAMNRIAWLGQAAACYALGIPSEFRSGFFLLTEEEQKQANEIALAYLNKWMTANGRPECTMEEAYSGDRQSDIY